MLRFLVSVLALLLAGAAARAEIEFCGLLVMPGRTLFALKETSGARSEWVSLQATFAGFVVAQFDAATDTLTLKQGATVRRVRLKDDAKVKPSRLEVTGAISFGAGEKLEIERATLLFDQENTFTLKDGLTYRITPTRRPDGNHHYSIVIEQRDSNGRVDRLSAPSVITLPTGPFRIQVGEYSFSFTPKSP